MNEFSHIIFNNYSHILRMVIFASIVRKTHVWPTFDRLLIVTRSKGNDYRGRKNYNDNRLSTAPKVKR